MSEFEGGAAEAINDNNHGRTESNGFKLYNSKYNLISLAVVLSGILYLGAQTLGSGSYLEMFVRIFFGDKEFTTIGEAVSQIDQVQEVIKVLFLGSMVLIFLVCMLAVFASILAVFTDPVVESNINEDIGPIYGQGWIIFASIAVTLVSAFAIFNVPVDSTCFQIFAMIFIAGVLALALIFFSVVFRFFMRSSIRDFFIVALTTVIVMFSYLVILYEAYRDAEKTAAVSDFQYCLVQFLKSKGDEEDSENQIALSLIFPGGLNCLYLYDESGVPNKALRALLQQIGAPFPSDPL